MLLDLFCAAMSVSLRAYELAEQLLRRAQDTHDPVLPPLRGVGSRKHPCSGWLLPAREHLETAIPLYDHERHRPLIFRHGGADAGVGGLFGSVDRSALETKSDANLDLELNLRVVCHRTTDLLDLKPVDIAQGLARFGERIADCLMYALIRDADHFDYLVGFIRHRFLRAGPG
jgi:hypothetical protein